MDSTSDPDASSMPALEAVARQHDALLRDVEAAKRLLGHPELDIRMAAKARIEEAERAVLAEREHCAKVVESAIASGRDVEDILRAIRARK